MNQIKQTKQRKLTAGAVVGSAFLLMGLSMPACPGQQETEKKLQDVSAKVSLAEKSVSSQNERVKTMENEVADLKKALTEVAEVLKTHKTSIDELTAKIGEMSSRGGGSGAKKPAPRRR